MSEPDPLVLKTLRMTAETLARLSQAPIAIVILDVKPAGDMTGDSIATPLLQHLYVTPFDLASMAHVLLGRAVELIEADDYVPSEISISVREAASNAITKLQPIITGEPEDMIGIPMGTA